MFTTRTAENRETRLSPHRGRGGGGGGLGPSGRTRRGTGPTRPRSRRSTDPRPLTRRRSPGNLPPGDRLNRGPQTHRYIPQHCRRPAASGPNIDDLRAGRGADTLRHHRVPTPHVGQSQAHPCRPRPSPTPIQSSTCSAACGPRPQSHTRGSRGRGHSGDRTEPAADGRVSHHAPSSVRTLLPHPVSDERQPFNPRKTSSLPIHIY